MAFLKFFQGPAGFMFNIIRVFSVIAMVLVAASNVLIMIDDIKAYHTASSATTPENCDYEYYEYSSVPDQTFGIFWSALNRVLILACCVFLTLSEFGFPKKIFNELVPSLGRDARLTALGFYQVLIGVSVLSHYCDPFPQAAAWMLVIVGFLGNFALGSVFGKLKPPRVTRSFREPKEEAMPISTRRRASPGNFSYGSRQQSAVASSAPSSMYNEKQEMTYSRPTSNNFDNIDVETSSFSSHGAGYLGPILPRGGNSELERDPNRPWSIWPTRPDNIMPRDQV